MTHNDEAHESDTDTELYQALVSLTKNDRASALAAAMLVRRLRTERELRQQRPHHG